MKTTGLAAVDYAVIAVYFLFVLGVRLLGDGLREKYKNLRA